MNTYLKSGILWLSITAFLCILIWILTRSAWVKKVNEAKKETKDLKQTLNQRMELENDGLTTLKTQIEKLKKENESLRISVNALAAKPGRREMLKFEVYSKAIEKLTISNTGFAPLWASAVKEVESEASSDSLLSKIPFVNKLIGSSENN